MVRQLMEMKRSTCNQYLVDILADAECDADLYIKGVYKVAKDDDVLIREKIEEERFEAIRAGFSDSNIQREECVAYLNDFNKQFEEIADEYRTLGVEDAQVLAFIVDDILSLNSEL